MSVGLEINFSSLSMVKDELDVTIHHATSHLEQFIGDRDSGSDLQKCIENLKQIAGTLRMIQLHGAELYANEIVALANDITVGLDSSKDDLLEVLSGAFFLLPRYIEYVQQRHSAFPELLVPYINELRAQRDEAPLSESYFFSANLEVAAPAAAEPMELPSVESEREGLLRRIRLIYQVGLLGVLQGKRSAYSFGLMRRACEHLLRISGGHASVKLWWLAEMVLELFADESLEISRSRKMLLASLDRQIRWLVKQPESALDAEPPKGLIKELVYLVAVSAVHNQKVDQVLIYFQAERLHYADQDLISQRGLLSGPSAGTIQSLVKVLREELRNAQEMLDMAARSGASIESSYQDLTVTLVRIADILNLVGLIGPSESLKELVSRIKAWCEQQHQPEPEELLDVADAILYVESRVSAMERMELSQDTLNRASELAERQMVASTELHEAELVVITEAQAGIALVKRALTAFSESNYDRVHIANVSKTLNSIRGGMVVLGLTRAADLLKPCTQFVDKGLMESSDMGAMQHMLETFADAVIALEYYLDEVALDMTADTTVLEIGETSLYALGYPMDGRSGGDMSQVLS